jgi:hypothetical protein
MCNLLICLSRYFFSRQGQASGLVPLQQQTNPAASSSASSTAGRDLQTVHNSTMQQHTQPQQRNVVYQQAGYAGQGSDRQIQPVCIHIE